MSHTDTHHDDDHKKSDDDEQYLLSQLPKSKGWSVASELVLYQGFWIPSNVFPNTLTFQSHFQPHENDIFVASLPKSGTTWLKAIAFSVMNRRRYSPSDNPLLTANPHELAPFIEYAYAGPDASPRTTAAESLIPGVGGGRLWSTHVPYDLWSESAKRSPCRVVYVARNPLDVVVSAWHFGNSDKWTLEEYVDGFCKGEAHMFGPYCSHVAGYWRASLERPEKVLFLKYEEMREDAVAQVKRIGEFLGFGFSEEEVTCGAVEEVIELCSLKSLKSLEVNKSIELFPMYENKSFFRKGEVGDWVNHLTPSMARRIKVVVEEKLSGSGLTFKLSI